VGVARAIMIHVQIWTAVVVGKQIDNCSPIADTLDLGDQVVGIFGEVGKR